MTITNLQAFKKAAHAHWCGPDCYDNCREWGWDAAEVRAGLRAIGIDPNAPAPNPEVAS